MPRPSVCLRYSRETGQGPSMPPKSADAEKHGSPSSPGRHGSTFQIILRKSHIKSVVKWRGSQVACHSLADGVSNVKIAFTGSSSIEWQSSSFLKSHLMVNIKVATMVGKDKVRTKLFASRVAPLPLRYQAVHGCQNGCRKNYIPAASDDGAYQLPRICITDDAFPRLPSTVPCHGYLSVK